MKLKVAAVIIIWIATVGLFALFFIVTAVKPTPVKAVADDQPHRTVREIVVDAVTIASDEDVAAAEIHLKKCGLHEASDFSTLQAWIREINGYGPSKADAETENAAIMSLLIWSERLTDPKIRAAYIQALAPHQKGVTESLSEFETHQEQKHMAEYVAGAAAREVKAREIQSKMPSPCHSSGNSK